MKTATTERVPELETTPLSRFCDDLDTKTRKVVAVTPRKGMAANFCYPNVLQVCEEAGGRPVVGWKIWHWPRVWFHAVHHCIWEQPDGDWVDVTPQENGASKIFFAQAEQYAFDPLGLKLHLDKYKLLWQDRRLHRLVKLVRKRDKLVSDCRELRDGMLVPTYEQSEMDAILDEARPLWQWVERKRKSGNA